MRALVLFFLIVTNIGFSQNIHFNLSDYQAYKMPIINVNNQKQADEVSRAIEKNHFAELVWIDYKKSEIYLITMNSIKQHEIISYVNNYYNIRFGDIEELNLDNELYLNIYAQKSGILYENIPNQIPESIYLGDPEKSEKMFQIAKELWVNKYPEKYDEIYNGNKSKELKFPEHYPIFVNTGNIDHDNVVFDNAKKEWIKNYPDEYLEFCGQAPSLNK